VVAFSVLPFVREEVERARRRGADTRPFVSQLVQQQRAKQLAAARQRAASAGVAQEPEAVADGRIVGDEGGGGEGTLKLKGTSYGFLLREGSREGHSSGDGGGAYDPYFLDDPALQSGKERMVMNLPGLVASVLPYVRPRALKAQLNEQWAIKHQWVSRGLTLSKIRAAKASLLEWVLEANCEVSTAALAHVYFERLVLRRVVNKANRKLVAAVSLSLAAKWNEPESLGTLLAAVERHYSIPRATVFRSEFSAYAELAFDLRLEPGDIFPHFSRLLTQAERTPHDYLGEANFAEFQAEFLEPPADD